MNIASTSCFGYSVLTDEERSLWSILVDIGGGTTDIAIFTDGIIKHTRSYLLQDRI